MNNYTTLTRYKAATPRSARRQKGYTVPTISLPSGNSVSLGGVVMLSGEQTITSIKDFLAGIKIGGLSIYNSKPDTIFVDANLVVRGAVTMYGMNTTTSPSIFSALPIDGKTIGRNERGELYVIGGTSGDGGGTGGGISIADVENYLTGKGYITSSALEPYALKTSIPTNTNQLTNGAGFITGITSSMVTSALGYTPLSTGGGTITGEVTISCAANTPLKINSNATDSGIYFNHNGVAKTWVGFEASRGSVLYHSLGSHRLGINNDGVAFYDNNTLLHSGNYSNYALPITGGTVNGQVTSEGLRINQSAFDNGLVLNRTVANSGVGIVAMSNDVRLGTFGINGTKTFEIAGDNGIVAQVSTVTGEATFNGMTTIKHSGNTPLVINQTYATNNSRGIVLMNGSMANGHMYYSHLFGKAASSKNSAYVGFYNAGAGSDSNYLSMGLYGVNNVLNITAAGNVGIGTTSPSQKLHVAGNILATGAITMYYSSDKRLKQNIRKVNASKTLMSLGGVYQYEYIDSEVAKNSTYEGSHYGLIYQNVKGTTLKSMCHEREDGYGTLNYLDTNFISLIAGATMENISEIEKLKKANRELKKKVEQLEKRVV